MPSLTHRVRKTVALVFTTPASWTLAGVLLIMLLLPANAYVPMDVAGDDCGISVVTAPSAEHLNLVAITPPHTRLLPDVAGLCDHAIDGLASTIESMQPLGQVLRI
jgi:hypothetical protein